MKKDISSNFYQKCLILCSKILLNLLHIRTSTVMLPWQCTGFQNSPILKAFLATFAVPFWYLQMGASYARSSKHVNMLAQVCGLVYHFSCWKSLTYWNQVGGDWKRVSCHGNRIFYSCRCVSCRTVSLPSFKGLCCKLAKIHVGLFIYLI